MFIIIYAMDLFSMFHNAKLLLPIIPMMCSQVPYWTQVGSKLVKQHNCLELRARSQLSALKVVEGRAEALGWD